MPRHLLAALAGILALALGPGLSSARPGAGPDSAGSGARAVQNTGPQPAVAGELTRADILARIRTALARTHDPQQRAILKGLAWLQDFVGPDDTLDAIFSDYVMMLNELTTQRTRPAVTPVAGMMLRHAVRRARGRMERLFAADEDGKIDFLQILHLFRRWGARQTYRPFFRERFPRGFAIDYMEMFEDALDELEYYELGSVIIDTSFYELLRKKYPNLQYELPEGNFMGFLQELDDIPLMETYEDDEEGYSEQNYFVTHIVFAAIHYGEGPAPRGPLMDRMRAYLEREFATVRHKVGDLDLLAEFVHCLKILGRGHTSQVEEAVRHMLAVQNGDGSWGTPEDFSQSPYEAFHPTWAVILALNY